MGNGGSAEIERVRCSGRVHLEESERGCNKAMYEIGGLVGSGSEEGTGSRFRICDSRRG